MPRSSLLLLGLVALFSASAQNKSTLDAIVETKRFHVPGQGGQLDVNISVLGATAMWKANEHGMQQARVEALTIVERDTSIIDFRKSDVRGPERTDTVHSDFLIHEHFLLSPGEYVLSIELHDVNGSAENRSLWKAPVVVPALPEGMSFSQILLTSGMTEDGTGNRIPAPYAGTYYPVEVNKLAFYTELYGTDKQLGADSAFTLNYQVETFETKRVKGQFKGVQRAKAGSVVPVSIEFPIGELPSGNYLLAVEALGRTGEVLARAEQFVQRNNPLRYDLNALGSVDVTGTFADAVTDPDTLAEHIACLRPIASDLERRMIDDRWKDRDHDLMKRFFYTFWVNRDGYDPERAWRAYREQVRQANRMFSCRNLRGYESDQGIAFLKYGLPSTVVDGSNDNKQLPYLIWHFYKAGRYADKRLVFWQQQVGVGCWEVLHSEIPGEVKNPRWQDMLSSPLGPASQSDGTRVHSIEGQRVEDNFLRPH